MKRLGVHRECAMCGRVFSPHYGALGIVCSRGCANRLRIKAVRFRLYDRAELLPSGCMVWRGQTTKQGYGKIDIARRTYLTHRVAWELAHGPIPKGLVICHSCDVPACLKLEHLFMGTQAENLADARRKGRRPTAPNEMEFAA